MLKKATIIQMDADSAKIRILPINCMGSNACHECGLCSNGKAGKEAVELWVEGIVGISAGDTVEVEINEPRISIIALTIYMLPLILMFCGGYIGNTFFSSTGLIGGGVAGFGLAILIIYILNRTYMRIRGRIIHKV